MATARLSMWKTRDILRQAWVLGRTYRQVADSTGASLGKVSDTVSRAKGAELDWSRVEALEDDALELLVYPQRSPSSLRPEPDPAWIHVERRRPGVTLELLHLEYLEKNPTGYKYTAFCDRYRTWLQKRRLTMRQEHRAGDKLFVDYSGKKPHIVDAATGASIEVELFVAVLGASSYTYAEATLTQQGPDWIASHIRAFAFFGGVTDAVVPDQLKSGVTKACRYDPLIQKTYEELATHYGTTVVPARPGRSRDKAKVEVAVQVAQRWILARLRNRTFFSLAELNAAIAEELANLNGRRMRVYGASRRELFERLDRPTLKALPSEPFAYGDWVWVRPDVDYHVEVDFHHYSVPYQLVDEKLEARVTATTVEVCRNNVRVASHVRSFIRGGKTTTLDHMPKAHRAHAELSPSRLLAQADGVGENTGLMVKTILEEKRHPEQGYRVCVGILRLARKYSNERLEAACCRALLVRAHSYRHVESMLRHGLDNAPMPSPDKPSPPAPVHENVRGPDYYV